MSLDKKTRKEINGFMPPGKPIRVTAYCRLGRKSLNQESGYTAQEAHYQKLIEEQSNWIYTGIYVDEGSSRTGFKAMLADAKAGKINVIFTKSISRFCRNVKDGISIMHELCHRKPPVGVFLEDEGFFTLRSDADFILILLLTLAEMEAENKGNHSGCVFPQGGFCDEEG